MTSVLLVILQLSRLVPSTGSNRITHISDSSTTDLACGSLGTQVSSASLFFFGLPLLLGIYYWEERASDVFPSRTVFSTTTSMWCDITLSVDREKSLFGSLGMPTVSKNES
jgi:hypothetical protein